MTEYSFLRRRHPDTGWQLVQLTYGKPTAEDYTTISFAPELGSNLLSFQVGDTEYLCDTDETRGNRLLGTPILYPSPNRVRDARFTFGGRTFAFEPNDGPHFLHGLVRDLPWTCETPQVSEAGVSIKTQIAFEPGTRIYELFPIRNRLELTYTLRPGLVRFNFTVQNQEEEERLPFGLAIHPYFRVFGPRETVRLQVPAQKWMEAIDLIPTGRLLDLTEGPADLRQPAFLSELDLDDVFWGLTPEQPQAIYYDQLGKKVTLRASALFTHSVIYTPKGKPNFCVENQSCSTDAHNLYTLGFEQAAHLMVLEPGASLSAWVEIAVGDV